MRARRACQASRNSVACNAQPGIRQDPVTPRRQNVSIECKGIRPTQPSERSFKMKRTIITSLLALLIGSAAAFAADEPVTTLYKNNPDITSYVQLNP